MTIRLVRDVGVLISMGFPDSPEAHLVIVRGGSAGIKPYLLCLPLFSLLPQNCRSYLTGSSGGRSSGQIWTDHTYLRHGQFDINKVRGGEKFSNHPLRFPSFYLHLIPNKKNAMSVRFVDPETGRIVYPGSSNAPTPRLGTDAPPVGVIEVNPLLAPAMGSWDVRRPFETQAAQWPQEERAKLGQNATMPPTTLLEIQSSHLPWKIEVRPKTPNLQITVLDVLVTIYAALKPEITRGEWNRFDTAGRQQTVAARNIRVQECGLALQADELYKHPRRVDSLGEFALFAGLIPTPRRGPNTLKLKLRRRR